MIGQTQKAESIRVYLFGGTPEPVKESAGFFVHEEPIKESRGKNAASDPPPEMGEDEPENDAEYVDFEEILGVPISELVGQFYPDIVEGGSQALGAFVLEYPMEFFKIPEDRKERLKEAAIKYLNTKRVGGVQLSPLQELLAITAASVGGAFLTGIMLKAHQDANPPPPPVAKKQEQPKAAPIQYPPKEEEPVKEEEVKQPVEKSGNLYSQLFEEEPEAAADHQADNIEESEDMEISRRRFDHHKSGVYSWSLGGRYLRHDPTKVRRPKATAQIMKAWADGHRNKKIREMILNGTITDYNGK